MASFPRQEVLDDKALGREGEEMAASFLEGKGFCVLERNYRSPLGEIDLIVEDKRDKRGEKALVFVEVKTRRSVDQVSPRELISQRKQRQISRTAQHYLAVKGWQERDASFAVVTIDWSFPQPKIELIESAFSLSWGY